MKYLHTILVVALFVVFYYLVMTAQSSFYSNLSPYGSRNDVVKLRLELAELRARVVRLEDVDKKSSILLSVVDLPLYISLSFD